METQAFIGLMELSRVVGIPYWRITYAHKKGVLPWPNRIVNTLAYSAGDVRRVTAYFAAQKNRKRKVA